MLALQRAAGNAAVVQMIRQDGRAGEKEHHRHGAGCGHQQDGQPTVQRATVTDVDAQDFPDAEELSDGPRFGGPRFGGSESGDSQFNVSDLGDSDTNAVAQKRRAWIDNLHATVKDATAQDWIANNVPELANWATGSDDAGPFRRLEEGELWQSPERAGEIHGRAVIAEKSQANMTTMNDELGPDKDWREPVRRKIEAAVKQSVLHHYTSRRRAEKMFGNDSSGELQSRVKLEETDPRATNNTYMLDAQKLRNDGFVFFFIARKDSPFRSTRFASARDPARIVLPFNRLIESGWVMLEDLIEQDLPTLRSDTEGNLLAYKRDPEASPEGKMKKALAEITDFWEDFPELDARARKLSEDLWIRSENSKAITAFAQLHGEINRTGDYSGLVAALRREFAKSVRFSSQVRRYHPARDSAEPSDLRYMRGAGQQKRGDAEAKGEVKAYKERLHGKILAGPHIIPGLAARAVLEISRIEARGGHEALVNRMTAMSGDDLLDSLMKDFIRPQAMLPWSVAITREDVQYP